MCVLISIVPGSVLAFARLPLVGVPAADETLVASRVRLEFGRLVERVEIDMHSLCALMVGPNKTRKLHKSAGLYCVVYSSRYLVVYYNQLPFAGSVTKQRHKQTAT